METPPTICRHMPNLHKPLQFIAHEHISLHHRQSTAASIDYI